MSPEARERIAATKHVWEPRGNQVHLALQHFLEGAAQINPGDFAEWVDVLISHKMWDKWRAIACEHRMWATNHGITYAGSCDAVLTDGNQVMLMDLKTQSSANSSPRDCRPQLGAYVDMLNKRHQLQVDRCLIIWSKPGVVDFSVYTPDECYQKWEDRLLDYKASQVPL